MHMIASCVWLLFLLNKIFVTLADHYSHEHNHESRQSSSEIPSSSEEFDSKISSSGSNEINEDLDYITPIQRGYCKGHCGVADECADSDGELNCINGGGKRRKRSLSDFDRRKDKENNEGIPLKRESRKNLSNYDVGYDYYEDDYESDDARIVSGYNPVERPWMALILIKISSKSGQMCGGALVNNRFLVSAAHCFCISKDRLLPCTRKHHRTRTAYDTSKIVYFQLGINGDDITPFVNWTALAEHNRNKYRAQKVLFHPRYFPYKKFPDISLVKANRPIEFQVGYISPICLPFKKFMDIPPRSDFELKAYVAGWGRDTSPNREPLEPVCHTDRLGPSPYSACSFPFRIDGKKFFECATTEPPPSFKHHVCNDFFQWAKHKNTDLWIGNHNDSYLIKYFDKYKNQFKRIQCYKPESKHGWCGTCYDYEGESIKSQEEGYCKKRKTIGLHIVNRLEYSRPTTSRHWGWCSEKCHTIAKLYSNKLKETKVDVLTLQECKILGKQQRVNLNYEFCAGNKRLYPKTKVYRRIYDERKRRFWYKVEKKTETNYLSWGKKGRKFDFFIGGTDACQGDSGGPIYVWNNSRAYLIGVVSRGKECALFNHPGIYTRITQFVPWILKTIKAGKCGNSQKS